MIRERTIGRFDPGVAAAVLVSAMATSLAPANTLTAEGAPIEFGAPIAPEDDSSSSFAPQLTSPGVGRLVAVFTQNNEIQDAVIASSEDGGFTWSQPQSLNDRVVRQSHEPTVVWDGVGLAAWPFRPVETAGGFTRIAVRPLDRLGAPAGPSVVLDPLGPLLDRSFPVVDIRGDIGVCAWRERSLFTPDTTRVVAALSRDGYRTWSASAVIDTFVQSRRGPAVATNGDVCLLTYAALERYVVRLDLRSDVETWGRVYTAPTEHLTRFGSDCDMVHVRDDSFAMIYDADLDSTGLAAVLFSRTDDNGSTWSAPRIVSRAEAVGQHAGEPFLWVDERMWFHVVWRQNTPFVFDQTLFYACSTDGGASWSVPVALTEEPGVLVISGSRGASLCVDTAGEVVVAWAVNEPTGPLRLRFATTRMTPFSVSPVPGAFLQTAPNPFWSRATVRVAVPEAAEITADIFDVGGRRVASLARPPNDRGDVEIAWTGVSDRGDRLPAGVYLWNITVRGETYGTTHRAQSVKLSR